MKGGEQVATPTDTLDWVTDGKLDGVLESLQEAVIARRRILAQREALQNLAELKPGTRVRLQHLKPKYLNNRPGTVRDPDALPDREFSQYDPNKHLIVEMDVEVRRYGKFVTVPANCLRRAS